MTTLTSAIALSAQSVLASAGLDAGDVGNLAMLTLLVGAFMLILGLLTRPLAILLAIDMAVALVLVHLSAGLWVSEGGYEFVAVLGAASLALALIGAGRFSIDGAFLRGRAPAWLS